MSVLEVRELTVDFEAESGPVTAVRGVHLSLEAGEILAVVGESGAGKSTIALALMGLLPGGADVSGSVRLAGQELLGLDDRGWSALRGSKIAMVFAGHDQALTPVYSVGAQLVEALQIHRELSTDEARAQAVELLDTVGIAEPKRVFDAFPHELSGGQRQRVLIAIAVANDPAVLIADEPTSAVDVTVQAEVLDVFDRIRSQRRTAILLITHDLAMAVQRADRLAVLYAGSIVESGPVSSVLAAPRMPYTVGLLRCLPTMDADIAPLPMIADGNVATAGCAFAPRCPIAAQGCRSSAVSLALVGPGHQVACVRAEQVAAVSPSELYPAPESLKERVVASAPVVLSVHGLKKSYRRRGRFWGAGDVVTAVDGVDLELAAGQTLALVGESGAGKTTVLREILELRRPQEGTVSVLGHDVASLDASQRRELRRRIQVVFQNPMAALDPRLPVADILAEPLRLSRGGRGDLRLRIGGLLEIVGLRPELAGRFPQQLSDGERQRVGIARALATKPEVLLLDEPVSALDASLRSGVINLLGRLQAELGLSYLLVGHDLAVVRQLADHITVLRDGRCVEFGPAAQVLTTPAHPYTRGLLEATPRLPGWGGSEPGEE